MQGSPSGLVGRPTLVPGLREVFSCKGKWEGRLPLVYAEEYNIRAFGLEKLHPFDSCKFGKIVSLLNECKICKPTEIFTPLPTPDQDLLEVHSPEYLEKLKNNKLYIAQVAELPLLLLLPKFLLRRYLVEPLRFNVGGTVLAFALAVEHGWAINIGGGMHHARRDHGEGWCYYADIMLGIVKIRKATKNAIQKILYVDCDVHQGNGVERDKLDNSDDDLFIVDVYNRDIWPRDRQAATAIDISVTLRTGTSGREYLIKLQKALTESKERFEPDLLVYSAGTDVLRGDPLGKLDVNEEAVLDRDEMVWQFAADSGIPIVMLLAGGYSRETHRVVANSIKRLVQKFNLKF